MLSTTPLYVGIYAAGNSTNSAPVMGAIGITVTGVAIYNNADALRSAPRGLAWPGLAWSGPQLSAQRAKHQQLRGVPDPHWMPGPPCRPDAI